MEKTEELVFGLDIGTRSIVGTVGYKKSTNDFTVVAQAVKLHDTRAMMDGQIHDIGRVSRTIAKVKEKLEDQIKQPLTDVCIAAAGRVLKTITVKSNSIIRRLSIGGTLRAAAQEIAGARKTITKAIKAEARAEAKAAREIRPIRR